MLSSSGIENTGRKNKNNHPEEDVSMVSINNNISSHKTNSHKRSKSPTRHSDKHNSSHGNSNDDPMSDTSGGVVSGSRKNSKCPSLKKKNENMTNITQTITIIVALSVKMWMEIIIMLWKTYPMKKLTWMPMSFHEFLKPCP